MRFIYLLFSFFILSCGSQKQEDGPVVTEDTLQKITPVAEGPVENFGSLLKGITIANINQYIHPQNGLWIIQSSGAMPNMTRTTQVDKNFPVDFSNVQAEELPKVNCDSKSFWTKEGCFMKEANSFKEEKIWTFCGLSREDEAKISEAAQTISWTIINTSLYARYYFSMIDGKWYLVFADLRRPCEA